MDGSYITAIVGLLGAAIGGSTSFATSWLTQRVQMREKALSSDLRRREILYTSFINEASRLFGDALSHTKDDVCDLVNLYALVARLRLFASPPIVTAAEGVVSAIIKTYGEPNLTLHELQQFARAGGMEPLLAFSEACRCDLVIGVQTRGKRAAPR